MKKLLLLAGILVVGATSFGYYGHPGYPGHPGHIIADNNSEADLKVTANVVRDLRVKAGEVKFGDVAAGMKNVAPKENGKIEIKGVKGASVDVALVDEIGKKIDENSVVYLRNPLERREKLAYRPGFSDTRIILGDNGEGKVEIKGALDVPDRLIPGGYSTTLKVKVSYAEFAKN